MKVLIILSVCIWSLFVSAGNLLAPFSSEHAEVLPPGIRSVRVHTFTVQLKEELNSLGQTQALGSPLNQKMTWDKVFKAQTDLSERVSLKAYLQDIYKNSPAFQREFKSSEVLGQTYGEVNGQLNAYIPVFAYGLTKAWNIGFAVPIVQTQMRVSTGIVTNEVFAKFTEQLKKDGKYNKAVDAIARARNPIQTNFQRLGYSPNYAKNKTEIGDVIIANKIQLHKSRPLVLAIQPQVALPTGRHEDVNDPFDIGSGDGQTDVGLRVMMDNHLSSRVVANSAISYTAQLADKRPMRVPDPNENNLSADVDDRVNRDLGDIYTASTGGQWKFNSEDEGWNVQAYYGLQYKTKDRYRPSRSSEIERSRYEILESDTEQVMQTAQVGLGYSSVTKYFQNKMPLPFEASVRHSFLLNGRNVVNSDLTSFEMVMYF